MTDDDEVSALEDLSRREAIKAALALPAGVAITQVDTVNAQFSTNTNDTDSNPDKAAAKTYEYCGLMGAAGQRDKVDASEDCSLVYQAPDVGQTYYSPIGIEGWYKASKLAEKDGYLSVLDVANTPSSVVHQYRAEDFADPWPDNVGSADLSTISGVVQDSFSNGETSVFGNGSSDYASGADGPQTIVNSGGFAFACTLQYSNVSTFERFFGCEDPGGTEFAFMSGGDQAGSLLLQVKDDNGNVIQIETNNTFDDGSPHAVVVNVNDINSEDVDFYVDDMTTAVGDFTRLNQGFDAGDYNNAAEMALYASNNSGSKSNYVETHAGVFEYNTEVYTETERDDFVKRRPEV